MRTPCYEWPGFRSEGGYGLVHVLDRYVPIHRVVWEAANGPIPEGMEVCHHCDNPPCYRLDHLFSATHKGNMGDRNMKGRAYGGQLPGELNPQAKLTQADVTAIRELLAAGSTQGTIALVFGVSQACISNIKRGVAW